MTLSSSLSQKTQNITAALQGQIEQVLREQQELLRRQEAHRKAGERRKKKEEKWRQDRLAERIPIARRGILRLVEFLRSSEIQQMLDLIQKTSMHHSRYLDIYQATRSSGERGSRDVHVRLINDVIHLEYGSFAAFDVVGFEVPLAESEKTFFDKVDSIALPYYKASSLIARRYDYEWHPNVVAFQFFVDLADSRKFKRLMEIALSAVKEEMHLV